MMSCKRPSSSSGDQLIRKLFWDISRPDTATPPALAVGTVIKDRFVIEGLLGRGGMGVVYRAKDLRKEETQDRDPFVAMKVLGETYRRDQRMIIAMQREARKAQTLAHPNISTVYDFDRDGQMVFLTMEMLQGDPLDEFIKKNPHGIQESTLMRLREWVYPPLCQLVKKTKLVKTTTLVKKTDDDKPEIGRADCDLVSHGQDPSITK